MQEFINTMISWGIEPSHASVTSCVLIVLLITFFLKVVSSWK